MPQPRYRLVDTDTTPYYHCISRCVRRAFLCGIDKSSGQNFDHRKQWILDRIKLLSSAFAIDVCVYAIMSNHFHLVLHVDTERASLWSDDQVIEKWLMLYKGPPLIRKYKAGEPFTVVEQKALANFIEDWRSRLADLSWYMRCLNEAIARQANAEDQCTGRFWEGRFRSQALLDEAALLSCMAYVDLNPIRAGLRKTLQDSEFTSIQERLSLYASKSQGTKAKRWLLPLNREAQGRGTVQRIPIDQTDYFALVDWTGRTIRDEKRGAIPESVTPILDTLGVDQQNWVSNTQHFGKRFYRGIGPISQLRQLAINVGQRWIQGHAQVSVFYN